LAKARLKWIEACEKAGLMVASGHEMGHLYQQAVHYYGEGELRIEIQSLAFDALHDEDLQLEIFAHEEVMLSFFCGIWIQFLLTEIAGLKGEELRTLALRVFKDFQAARPFTRLTSLLSTRFQTTEHKDKSLLIFNSPMCSFRVCSTDEILVVLVLEPSGSYLAAVIFDGRAILWKARKETLGPQEVSKPHVILP